MTKFTIYKSLLSELLLLPLCILCICCDGSSKGDSKHPLSESYKFTSDVTSVNLYDSVLYLGLYSDQFVKFDPRNGNSRSYKLPSRLNNTHTYYIYPLSDDSFLVSKRNFGVTLVNYPNPNDGTEFSDTLLRQDSVHKPYKGENYSSYNIYPFGDSLLVGSTNGLMIMPKSGIKNPLNFVSSLVKFRNGVTQYTIEDIYGVDESIVDVYTKNKKWRLTNSTNDIIGTKIDYKKINKRCFENWELSVDRDTLIQKDCTTVKTYYLGALGIPEKGATIAILDSTLYYVSDGKLHSVYLPSLTLLNRSVYEPLTFVARDTNMMYLANNSGLYQVDSSGMPKYMHSIDRFSSTANGIIHNNTIYTIDNQGLYKITPKGRYNFTQISPELIVNIVEQYADNVVQEDELKCIDISDGIIYIGSRNNIYRYDLKNEDITILKNQDTEDNFINPYYTTISYPYAGTLNDGIHLIDDDNQLRRIHLGPKDIRQLVCCQSYLACLTNDSVQLYEHEWGENLKLYKTYPYINGKILDIALTNDSLYLLCPETLISISIKEEGTSTKPNPGYTSLSNLENKIIPYSVLSVVDGYVLDADPVDWGTILAIAGFLILMVGFTIVLIKLQSRRKNPEYHSAKDIIKKLTKSSDCKTFLSAQTPVGYSGELRKQMSELLNTVINTSIANADEMIAAKRQLVDFSNVIFGRFVELRSNLSVCRDTMTEKLYATDSVKADAETKSFINNIIELINGLKWNSLKDIDIVKLSISIIERLEKVYSEINNQMKVAELQVLADEVICQDNTENAEDLADFLILDKALISSLLLKVTGKSVFFWDKPLDSDPNRFKYSNKYYYMWSGLLLLSLTNIDPEKIKKYLNDSFFPIFESEDTDSVDEKSKNRKENWKQLMSKSHNPIASFFSTRSSQEVWERESFIPAMPFDLVLISSIRFNDKRMQMPDKAKE